MRNTFIFIALTAMILLVSCNQGLEKSGAYKKVATPLLAKKLDLSNNGFILIKFGTSYEEAQKILTNNKIEHNLNNNEMKIHVFGSLQVNEVPVDLILLKFNYPAKLMDAIEIKTTPSNWRDTELSAGKLINKTSELLGKPSEASAIIEADTLGTKSIGYTKWGKGNVSSFLSAHKQSDSKYYSGLIIHNNNISEEIVYSASSKSLTKAGKRVRKNHPNWDDETCNVIGSGKINIGMTKEQVRAAWGRPYKVNQTINANGTSEQWVMRESGGSYVYFEGDTCTTIQN